jgi:hypothetical protein
MATVGSWLLNIMSEAVLGSIADLTVGPLRAAATQIIREVVPLGLKPSEIMSELSAANIYYGRKKMLDDIRTLYTTADNREYMSTHRDDKLVALSRMGESDLPRDADFLVTFRVNVTNPLTGATTEEFRSMYTNQRATPDDYWMEFVEGMSETEYDVAFEYEYLGTETVVHNRGFPYGE